MRAGVRWYRALTIRGIILTLLIIIAKLNPIMFQHMEHQVVLLYTLILQPSPREHIASIIAMVVQTLISTFITKRKVALLSLIHALSRHSIRHIIHLLLLVRMQGMLSMLEITDITAIIHGYHSTSRMPVILLQEVKAMLRR